MKAVLLILLLGQLTVPLTAHDPLRSVMLEMQEAACCRFEFVSIVESDIFNAVDSTVGEALLAGDGRYWVKLGSDEYWQTADRLYSYSRDNNQVTLEERVAAPGDIEELSFIIRLEDHYYIKSVMAGTQYLLDNKSPDNSQLPKQMTLRLNPENRKLANLEYLDINGELNRIVFSAQEFADSCDETMLTPTFPDSVETIRLF